MSVILYSRDEVLNAFAATWNRGSAGSSDALRYMDYLAEAANRIMEANRQCYCATYSDTAEPEAPITGRDIKMALIRKTVHTNLDGMRCLRGLRYNLIANNGQDFATAEILDDLLSRMTAAYELALPRHAEAR